MLIWPYMAIACLMHECVKSYTRMYYTTCITPHCIWGKLLEHSSPHLLFLFSFPKIWFCYTTGVQFIHHAQVRKEVEYCLTDFFWQGGTLTPWRTIFFPLVLIVNWWYWFSILRYWLVFGSTGLGQGGTGCQCDMHSENIWLTWCKPSTYSIVGEVRSDDGQMDR